MIIYLDVVFLENLIMNYIILFATAVINKENIKLIRLFLASSLGALYAVISYTEIMENMLGILLKIALSVAMVYIAFNPQNFKKCVKQLLIFYLTSFTFGGVVFTLLYFVKPGEVLMRNGVFIGTYPLKIAFLGGVVGFALITITFKIVKEKLIKNIQYEIEIKIRDKVKSTKAILDTGNFLKEPITGISVIIIEKEELKGFLPVKIIENIENIVEGKMDNNINLDGYIERFRVIPFSSIGKENGLLLGIKADYVKIKQDDKEVLNNNVILGIFNGILSKSKNYHALIGLDLLEEGGVQNEYFRNVKV